MPGLLRREEPTCIEVPVEMLELLERARRRGEEYGMSFEAVLRQALSLYLHEQLTSHSPASPPESV